MNNIWVCHELETGKDTLCATEGIARSLAKKLNTKCEVQKRVVVENTDTSQGLTLTTIFEPQRVPRTVQKVNIVPALAVNDTEYVTVSLSEHNGNKELTVFGYCSPEAIHKVNAYYVFNIEDMSNNTKLRVKLDEVNDLLNDEEDDD